MPVSDSPTPGPLPVQQIDDYPLLERYTLAFFEGLSTSVAEALAESIGPMAADQKRAAVERVLWTVATHLDERNLGSLDDGRPVRSSLGFIAVGSASAFEVPFVEHQGVLAASRISLHEYVHEAVERALRQEASLR